MHQRKDTCDRTLSLAQKIVGVQAEYLVEDPLPAGPVKEGGLRDGQYEIVPRIAVGDAHWPDNNLVRRILVACHLNRLSHNVRVMPIETVASLSFPVIGDNALRA